MKVDASSGWCEALKCPTSKVAVFLNDVLLDYCVAADTDEGWADIHALDARGRPKLEGQKIKIERRYGRVELKRWADKAKRK